MTLVRILRAALLFIGLVALHYSVRPLLGWRAGIDFLVIALLIVAVRLRPGGAAVVGFVLGLLADSLVPGVLGASALAMCIIGFGASWLKALFFADNVVLNGFFFFLGKWVYDLIYLAIDRRLGGSDLMMQALLWSPLAAAATAAAGVLLLLLLRPVLEVRSS